MRPSLERATPVERENTPYFTGISDSVPCGREGVKRVVGPHSAARQSTVINIYPCDGGRGVVLENPLSA